MVTITDSGRTAGNLLPEDVRKLIVRKLHSQRIEQEQQLAAAVQLAHSNLKKEIEAVIGTSRFARAFTSIPLAVFKEIVDEAVAMTRSWPGTAWETITSVLSKLQLGPYDSNELQKIIDECTWCEERSPFTYRFVVADNFRERFFQLISSYGLQRADLSGSFNSQLELAAATACCGVLNTARWAREEIGIDIDEYLIEQRFGKAIQGTNIFDNSSPPDKVEPASIPVTSTCKKCEVFLEMKNLTSDELRISFVGDKAESGLAANNMLEISARKQSKRFTPGELNLVDGRSGRINSQGILLLGMARKLDALSSTRNGKKIDRLRNILRKNLGVQDNPFDTLKSGWAPRFGILDSRGSADEREKQEAERRTVSLDQQDDFAARSTGVYDSEYPHESEGDETDDWLKNRS